MRVACGLAKSASEAIGSTTSSRACVTCLAHQHSSTLGPCTHRCHLVTSWTRQRTTSKASTSATPTSRLSKHAGGIGLAYHRVRSQGSLIKGTNGKSSGIVPFLNTLDASVAAVNQGGRRKGACCVYLETWHADIESFLELRDNAGDDARQTRTT